METTVGNQDMQMGVKSLWKISECLYGDNSTGYYLTFYHMGTNHGCSDITVKNNGSSFLTEFNGE